jgi:hypothetical protein
MLTDLPKGDYVVNYGGSMAALRNPSDPGKSFSARQTAGTTRLKRL